MTATPSPPLDSSTGNTLEPLSTRLRSGTQTAHTRAERHPFHAALFGAHGPALAREALLYSLGQHLYVQQSFVPRLQRAAESGSSIGSLVREYHNGLPSLRGDLETLRAEPRHLRPMRGAERCASFIEECSNGPALLGVWYVFEGSTNGGTVIAKKVREVLNLPDERGTRFINPHGLQVRARWSEWKTGLDAVARTATDRDAIVDAARQTFEYVADIMDDVVREIDALRTMP